MHIAMNVIPSLGHYAMADPNCDPRCCHVAGSEREFVHHQGMDGRQPPRKQIAILCTYFNLKSG